MAYISKSFGTLSDLVSSGTRNSESFNTLDDFMRDNAPTWRSESRNAFQQSELAEAVHEAFIENSATTYTLSLSGGAYVFMKAGVVVAKISIDMNAGSPYTLVAEKAGPSAPAGFTFDNGQFVKSVRHISDGFKAAREHSMGVRRLIDALRSGSNTFRSNYDNSYVTPTEMLMSALEFSGSPQAQGYTVAITDGRMTFVHQGTEVMSVNLKGDLKVFTPAGAGAAAPSGWTFVTL